MSDPLPADGTRVTLYRGENSYFVGVRKIVLVFHANTPWEAVLPRLDDPEWKRTPAIGEPFVNEWAAYVDGFLVARHEAEAISGFMKRGWVTGHEEAATQLIAHLESRVDGARDALAEREEVLARIQAKRSQGTL